MKSESFEKSSLDQEKFDPTFVEKEADSTRLVVSNGPESVAQAAQDPPVSAEQVNGEQVEEQEKVQKIQAFLQSLRSSTGATESDAVEEIADAEESLALDREESQLPDWCRALEDVPVSPVGTAQSWIDWFRGFWRLLLLSVPLP